MARRPGARILSFVNMQPTHDHGTHVQGLERAFAAWAAELGADPIAFTACVEPGLIAIVHVGLYHPRWGNPTKEQLVSPIAGEVVAKMLAGPLGDAWPLRALFTSRPAAR